MDTFELLLCSTNVALARRASAGGLDGVIVDWERHERLSDVPNLAPAAIDDLGAMRAATPGTLIARLNRFGPWTRNEIEVAVAHRADEVLLTMVRSVEEVNEALRLAGGRCRVGIVVETEEAVRQAPRLAELPIARVHMGLKDLAEARGYPSMFTSVRNGAAEAIRAAFRVPVGFAGITLPDTGDPIPSRLLIGEMVRVGCGFAMLGASFHRDVEGRDAAVEIPRLRAAIGAARRRSAEEVREDRLALDTILLGLAA